MNPIQNPTSSNHLRKINEMTSNASLLLRRAALATTAITMYGASAFFVAQAMSPSEKRGEGKDASSSAGTCACCTPYTTSPERNEKYQEIAKVYDDQISRDEFVMGLPLLRRCLLYFNAQGSVLEVGAGTGRNLDYYPSTFVNEVVLTDRSAKMLMEARDKIIEKKKKTKSDLFKVFVADAGNMSKYYKENRFDTIVSTFTLCSFDDPVEVLKELQMVCKIEGKILLLEHGRSKSWDGLSNYLDKNAERHAKNWGCVWNRDLDDIIDKAGLEIEKISRWHFGTTYYVVCRPSAKVKEERKRIKAEELQRQEEGNKMALATKKDSGWKQWKNLFHTVASWKRYDNP